MRRTVLCPIYKVPSLIISVTQLIRFCMKSDMFSSVFGFAFTLIYPKNGAK